MVSTRFFLIMTKKLFLNHKTFWSGTILLFLLYIPFFFFGENSIIIGFDNVDCDLIYKHLLKQSKHLFCLNPSHEIPIIFSEFKSTYIHSTFNFNNLFYFFFPTFWAYILNSFFARLIGYVGVYLLLKVQFKLNNKVIILLLSLMYALMPFYSIYGISIMGLPLLYTAFCQLAKSKSLLSSLGIILFYTSYSHFFLVGPFVIIFFGSLFLMKSNRNKNYFYGLTILVLGFLIFNSLFLYQYFFGVVSHRIEFNSIINSSNFVVSSAFYQFLRNFLFGIEHFSYFFIGPLIVLFVLTRNNPLKSKNFLAIIGFSLVTVIYERYLPQISFTPTRFTLLFPLLILLSYVKILKQSSISLRWVSAILIAQIIININNDTEVGGNIKRLVGFKSEAYFEFLNKCLIDPFNNNIKDNKWPYQQIASLGFFGADKQIRKRVLGQEEIYFDLFYSKSSFDKIKSYIPKNAKTINIGFHPSISHFNGVSSLDSYQVYYPLVYKKKFRKIIQPELKKNKNLEQYFDYWGNRVYSFSNELFDTCKFDCTRSREAENKIKSLDFNMNYFGKMGGTHVVSAVEILNFKDLDLVFLAKIDDPKSRYIFYLYEFIENKHNNILN